MKENEFDDWRAHPVTRELCQLFNLEIAEQGRRWSEGSFLRNRDEELGVLGRLAGYRALIDLNWTDVQDMLREQKEGPV